MAAVSVSVDDLLKVGEDDFDTAIKAMTVKVGHSSSVWIPRSLPVNR